MCLGNPGPRYASTRHNVGFRVGDLLASESHTSWRSGPSYLLAETDCDGSSVLLIKPTTYMNDSGKAVADAMQAFALASVDVLVLLDDVHIELGRLRARRRGSDGGHNGMRSITETLGHSDIPRLRLGIGMPPEGEDLIDFVLGTFEPGEEEVVEALVRTAADGVRCWSTQGMDALMNGFNSNQ